MTHEKENYVFEPKFITDAHEPVVKILKIDVDGEPVLTIEPDGTFVFHDETKITEAARVFADYVTNMLRENGVTALR